MPVTSADGDYRISFKKVGTLPSTWNAHMYGDSAITRNFLIDAL